MELRGLTSQDEGTSIPRVKMGSSGKSRNWRDGLSKRRSDVSVASNVANREKAFHGESKLSWDCML